MTSAPPARAWQRMLSGRRLDLLDPRPEDIAIEDIAHGLARVARWNGQTLGRHIFSVAQHSLLVEAIFATDRDAPSAVTCLAALLHDGAEYVVGDLISPLKAALGGDYQTVEARLLQAIQTRFGIGGTIEILKDAIKSADRAAARLEATTLAGFAEPEATRFFGAPLPAAQRFAAYLEPWPADLAQSRFLDRFADLWSRLKDETA